MSALKSPAGEPLSATDTSAIALLTALVGKRVTIAQAAAAIGVTERAVYKSIAEHSIPFVKVLGTRYLDPADLSRALIKQHNAPPRGRGRPPKSASGDTARIREIH